GHGPSRPGCAAALHRVSSRLENARQAADVAGNPTDGAPHGARGRAAPRVHGKYPRSGRPKHLLPWLRGGANRPRLVRVDGLELGARWAMPVLRDLMPRIVRTETRPLGPKAPAAGHSGRVHC